MADMYMGVDLSFLEKTLQNTPEFLVNLAIEKTRSNNYPLLTAGLEAVLAKRKAL